MGESINKLHNEKVALQTLLEPSPEDDAVPFDLVQELIADATQIWVFADEIQKHHILQSIIRKFTLRGDDIEIELAF